MPVSEEENRQRPNRPMSRAEWEYLRWRKFTWLPGEIEITVAGKEPEKRTAERDEGGRDEGA